MNTLTCRACGGPLKGRQRTLCSAECLRVDERNRYNQQRPPKEGWKALDLTDADAAFRERFWSKVDVRGPDECWPWTRGRIAGRGYGQFTIRKWYSTAASRVAYALDAGPLKAGEVACHTCDNPPCCNPAHLFKGTQVDNGNDSVLKGRNNAPHGSASGSARLTPEIVAEIRAMPIKFGIKSALARKYGVSEHTIRKALAGQTWRDVA